MKTEHKDRHFFPIVWMRGKYSLILFLITEIYFKMSNDIVIKNLADIKPEDITAAFLDAFADYSMSLDERSLADMLKRRGAVQELSFGAFDRGRIVSFIINGIGDYSGRRMAYDTGTGTVKEYRGLGLTDRIFNYSVEHLVNAGVKDYVLEVLTDNIPAVKIYSRQGFKTVREFDCFTAANESVAANLKDTAPGVKIRRSDIDEVRCMAGYMDFEPSWQNSFESIGRNPEAFLFLAAYDGDAKVGFGVSETAYGDITLLAVDKSARRQGVGSALLRGLVAYNRIGRAKVINVDSRCVEMKSFLEASGFELSCRQYEMMKKLV